MPIVDSSRPSHSAPPFEPWLTGSGLLLLFWVGVIEMNGLVVAVTPNGWVGGAVVPGKGSPSTRNVVKSCRIVSPAASASRHDTVQAPLGTGVLIGIVTTSPSASTSGEPVSCGCDGEPHGDHDRSVVAAQLLVEGEHDRRRGLFERRPVLRFDRLEQLASSQGVGGSPVARTARVPNAPRTVVSARWSTPEGFGRERSPLLTANTVARAQRSEIDIPSQRERNAFVGLRPGRARRPRVLSGRSLSHPVARVGGDGDPVPLPPLPAAALQRAEGQDHVVKALRDSVREGREGQAYLFSGPRGTGKTTTARILAKVLNCENVVDGEPCCECESCLAVERGTSYDVHRNRRRLQQPRRQHARAHRASHSARPGATRCTSSTKSTC